MNFFEHFLVFASSVSGCDLISALGSLVGVPVGTARSAVGLKICAVAAGIKKYNLIYIEKEEKHDKIVLLGKTKIDQIPNI